MADLPTNYLDDILAQSMNGKRKYRITRADGTFEEVTLEDVSEYEQVGSNFGAGDINKTNQAVNEKFDSGDVVDPMLTTEPGFAADAYQTKLQFDEQNKKFETEVLTDVITPVNGITLSNVKVLRYGKNIYASFIASWSDASQQVDLAYIDNSILPVAPVISSCQVKDNDVYYMGIVKHTSTNILTAYISKTTKALDISAHWIIA